MLKAFARGLGISLSFAVTMSACFMEGNHFGDSDDEEHIQEQSAGVCGAFCEELVGCGTLNKDAEDACVDNCQEKHAFTPALTEQGATCVLDAGCKPLDEYECPGAPIPSQESGGDEGDEGSSSGDASSGSASSGDAPSGASCQADCDCPSGDACIEGACKTPCNASCECAEGESCVEGYCETPEDPPTTCETDCDCPSGEVCEEGVCG